MPPQDVLMPLVEHLGFFVAAVASPVTAVVIGLLALGMNRQRNFLMAAALVGMSDASLGTVASASAAGLATASVVGAAGSLLQAWVMWPFAQSAKRIHRRFRERTER